MCGSWTSGVVDVVVSGNVWAMGVVDIDIDIGERVRTQLCSL